MPSNHWSCPWNTACVVCVSPHSGLWELWQWIHVSCSTCTPGYWPTDGMLARIPLLFSPFSFVPYFLRPPPPLVHSWIHICLKSVFLNEKFVVLRNEYFRNADDKNSGPPVIVLLPNSISSEVLGVEIIEPLSSQNSVSDAGCL